MGCGSSSLQNQYGSPEDKRRNDEIEKSLQKARQEMKNTIKMLLLGAGESGKSTLLKQMRLCYSTPFSPQEREAYREVVLANTLQSMQAVIRGFEMIEQPIPPRLQTAAAYVLDFDATEFEHPGATLSGTIYDALATLWLDKTTKYVVSQASKFQLNDSAAYFFDAMPRLAHPAYVPTDEDILRTRVRSTGIAETHIQVKTFLLKVFDVGGQRSERKKWIHCFEGVQVLVFVVAISEYDQMLWEDETVNRLEEATMLWESVITSRWFESSAFVLLLNKIDLFSAKLPTSPLQNFFPAYQGRTEEDAKQFMLQHFKARDRRPDRRPLYHHFTCATDTELTKIVLAAVFDSILETLLRDVGLM